MPDTADQPHVPADASTPPPACDRTQETTQGRSGAENEVASFAIDLGVQLAKRARSYIDQAISAALSDADLSVEVKLWRPTFDPLTAPCWWQWRADCGCADTSFGRNPHHWNCPATPIWAQTIRDLDTNPWTVANAMKAIA